MIYYQRPTVTLSDFAGLASAQQRSELEMLFEMGTPRAYYLASSVPPLLRNEDLFREP